jgi:hypothetical protein
MTQADTPVTPVHHGQLEPAVSPSPLLEWEARQLTREIADTLAIAWDKIVAAYQRRVWEPLGYSSWDCYCRAELSSTRLRLPSEEREEAVRSLRSARLSTRAIAAATGQSHTSVRRGLAGGTNVPPAGAHTQGETAITGLDGKSYTGSHTTAPDTSQPIDAEIVDDQGPQPVPPASVPPATTKRRPLTDQAKDAGWEIRRAAERIARIVSDDRLPTRHQQVSFALRTHLLFTAQTVTTALDQLSDHT